MPHVEQKTTSEKWKFGWNKILGIEWTMNGLGKPFRKKAYPKNWKNSKNQSEIAACEQKTSSEKANFPALLSHSTLNLEQKNFTPQNHSLFGSTSCFGETKITIPTWLQKSWKCVKKTAPQCNSNSLNCNKSTLVKISWGEKKWIGHINPCWNYKAFELGKKIYGERWI